MATDTLNHETAASFQQLARIISDARIRAEEKAKATHERFNVFTTLLKAGDEVRLHTRFLHCLLDPNGTHDCGSLFLELFFETLREYPGRDHENVLVPMSVPCEEECWKVEKEASRSPHGQIDLLLVRLEFGIAIENKIHAYEQPRQLACYSNYLKGRFQGNARLIYLTLDGKCAFTHEDNPYIRISYAEHILAWLEKCLRATYRIIPVNQVLLQYREVVRQLTGRTLNVENMKPIINFIRHNPDIIKFRNDIAAATEEAIRLTWEQIESGIIDCLPEGWKRTTEGQIHKLDFDYRMTMIPPKDNVLCDAPFGIMIERDHEDYSIGIRTSIMRPQLSAQDNILFRKMKEDMPMDKENDWYPVGWTNLVPGVPDDKFAEVVQNPDIPGICNKVLDYINKLEAAYDKAKQGDAALPFPAPTENQ